MVIIELETAAYRLVAEQVIYHSDRSSRVTYGILGLYGASSQACWRRWVCHCRSNRQLRYVTALPRHAKAATRPWLRHCLPWCCAACTTKACAADGLTEDGEVCDYIELQEKFHLMTGRDLPTRGEARHPAALCQALGHRSASGRR